MDPNISTPLNPPNAAFRSRAGLPRSFASFTKNDGPDTPLSTTSDSKEFPTSLSTHYLPSKFSNTMLSGGPKRRKVWKTAEAALPKRGGGREAFRRDEARMPGEGDDDYDGMTFDAREGGSTRPQARWNRFKWALFVSNLVVGVVRYWPWSVHPAALSRRAQFTVYSIAGLVVCLTLWFNVWGKADIVRVGNQPELVVSTLAAALGVLTALVGWSGILLNNRAFLSLYCVLTWACFALLVAPGYITYKRRAFNLEGKLNQQWSEALGLAGRLRVQNVLHCCGYFSPFVEATVSQTCYARSVLPGCKAPYLRFERATLGWWYTAVFALVPAQIAVMAVGLLCANHVTYRFGKGMMPRAYRLDMNSLAIIMDNYASQLAEQYGVDVAAEVMARSRSNLQLDAMPTMPYSRSSTVSLSTPTRYNVFSSKTTQSAAAS